MVTKNEYIAAEKRFSALFEKQHSENKLSAAEKQELFQLLHVLGSYENSLIFWENIRSGDYRTN